MLFCVKASGFGYGGIVIFFIVLQRLIKRYREESTQPRVPRFIAAGKTALRLSLRLGTPVLLLVLVWGFAPYGSNILDGRNIFYPIISDGSERSGLVPAYTELTAKTVCPNAGNRFTRLLYSIASHTVVEVAPAKIKNPFDVPLSDWNAFSKASHARVAGLGPLFYLLLLLSVPTLFLFHFRGNGWLLLTLLALLFAQPYSWIMRFAPFLWIFPLACLMSLPEKRSVFLWIPLSIAFVNTVGVSYIEISSTWRYSNLIKRTCSRNAGDIVMLPQTIFEYDGIFDRYVIKQRYVNPEETDFFRRDTDLGLLSGNRTMIGVNFFFREELLALPETPIVLAEEAALPWLMMSEGLMPAGAIALDYTMKTEWRTYADKVKFYMSLDKEPKEDWILTLKGAVFDDRWDTKRELEVQIFINNHEIGTWQIDKNSSAKTYTIPRDILRESFEDETRLVTLMLRLLGVASFYENDGNATTYGLQLEEMQICPLAKSVLSEDTGD
jgi:hypothetical protein